MILARLKLLIALNTMQSKVCKNLYFAGENIIAPGLIGAFLGAEILMNYFEDNK
jgi:hypothetical protein